MPRNLGFPSTKDYGTISSIYLTVGATKSKSTTCETGTWISYGPSCRTGETGVTAYSRIRDPMGQPGMRPGFAAFTGRPSAQDMIREREIRQKRGQARLTNDRLMRQWGGASGSGRLNFRWPVVARLLNDIATAGIRTVLAPDNRALLLDALRPTPGHSLDRAVATTFTLDLETALMVPLAFAGFRFDENPDPIEVMEALRRTGERMDIFCQAGAISAARWPSDLVALLEKSIHEVRRPRPDRIFHPKVWALRLLNPAGDPAFRLVVLSRNLTASRSWDTILWLDGQPQGRRPNASNAPLEGLLALCPV